MKLRGTLGARSAACWGLLFVVVAGLHPGAAADERAELVLTRSVSGLLPDGTVPPGGTTLDITVTISAATGDPTDPALVALGLEETLPPGWSYNSSPAPVGPGVLPQNGAQGAIPFAYITVPSIPTSFTYRVNVPETATFPATLTGFLLTRFIGIEGEFESPIAETVFIDEIDSVVVSRTISGPGILPSGAFVPGETIEIAVLLERTGADPVTSLGYTETVPQGFAFAGLATENFPPIAPSIGTSGDLNFAFLDIPDFPISFSYFVDIGSGVFGAQTLRARTEARFSGEDPVIVEAEEIVLDDPPCIFFTREAPEFYRAGGESVFTITIDSTCDDEIFALGHVEFTPPGWTFVEVLGPNPPDAAVQTEATNELEFLYLDVPDFPLEFSYVLSVPVDDSGDTATVCGETVYRFDSGPEFRSLSSCSELTFVLNFPPVITLEGDTEIVLECGTAFVEPGFSAFDEEDGDLTDQVEVSNLPDTGTPGTYAVLYSVTDSNGATAEEVRTVIVEDTTPPVLTLQGGTVTVECGNAFNDPGATANDICAGNISGAIDVTGTVDTTTPGTYTLTYNVSDPSGNAATPVSRTVNVVDTTPPAVNLNGPPALTIECGVNFNDPGATAVDACAGNVSGSIVVTGSVNTRTPGTYTLTYRAADPAGNQSAPVTRTVTVADTTPPVITLNGPSSVTVECGQSYVDQGATANDSCAGSVNVQVDSSDVNTAVAGTYEVRFRAVDPSGNERTATRTVVVVDNTAPVISLVGANPLTVECGDEFDDPGATAEDACAGSVEVTADTSGLNMSVPGFYTVTYTAVDPSGNRAEATRSVEVRDTTPPVITLNGPAVVTVECGADYEDAGATADDACGGNLTDAIAVEEAVDTAVPGEYTVTYTVSDAFGNQAAATRTVVVADTSPPVITLTGAAEVTVECTEEYEEPGATASDVCDGDLTAAIAISGTVDTAVPGEYEIIYTVSDAAGNEAEPVVRTVTVVDTTPPVITLIGPAFIEVPCDKPYVDAGATAVDACDGAVEVTVDASDVDFEVTGEYTVFFEAVDAAGNVAVATRTVAIADNCFAVICADSSGNGYLDTPFQCLNAERNTFTLETESANCGRVVEMATWFDGGNGNISVSALNPVDEEQRVTLSVPRRAINRGEQGILVLAVSCDVPSLFAPEDTTFPEATLPPDVSPTAPYITAALLVSSDEGQTFSEVAVLGNERVAELEITGLIIGKDNTAMPLVYPTEIFNFVGEGLSILPEQGRWMAGGFIDTEFDGDTLRGTFNRFSAITVADRQLVAGSLLAFPPTLNFGLLRIGRTVDSPITIGNFGGTVISGEVRLEDSSGAFSLEQAAPYELGPGEFATIDVLFSPRKKGVATAKVLFTGDENGDVEVQLVGYGTLLDKDHLFLGCGAGNPSSGAGAGDMMVLMAMLGALVAAMGLRRRQA